MYKATKKFECLLMPMIFVNGLFMVWEMLILCRRRITLKDKGIRHYSSNLKLPIFCIITNMDNSF